ncbi:MAG: hypothetical protein R2720_03575 [Candidatus Nanopelagicales bacterium]
MTFNAGSPSTPITPPTSKPKSAGTLAGPIRFQVAENQELGPPTITSVQALQNPDRHSQIVIDLTWDAPISYADRSRGTTSWSPDDEGIDGEDEAWYVQYGAGQRDARISGTIVYASEPPHDVYLTVVAVDSRGDLGELATVVLLPIGCDAYGPGTGADNPYRTLCEHTPT